MAPRGRPRKPAQKKTDEAVPNSSSQPEELQLEAGPSSSRAIAVMVPPLDPGKRSTRQSTSTVASTRHSTESRDELSTYDTPGTSAAPTPQATTSSTSRKRARTSTDTASAAGRAKRRSTRSDYPVIDLVTDDSETEKPITAADESDDNDGPFTKRWKKTHPNFVTSKSRSSRPAATQSARRIIIDSDGDEPGPAPREDSEDFLLEDLANLGYLDSDSELDPIMSSRGQKLNRRRRGGDAPDGKPDDRPESVRQAYPSAPPPGPGAPQEAIWGTRAEKSRYRLLQNHPEIKDMWTELEAKSKIPMMAAAQPTSITRQLKPFQLEGLNWMIQQEKTNWKGGLLGDEMGMGKTIQAVSLIMSDYPAHAPTLVVVPPVALMQWTKEIKEYTSGKLNTLVYHGTNAAAKKLSVAALKKYDVIMISYSGLESLYRKQTKGWTRNESIVMEDSAIHAIHFHRLILDEAHSIKTRTTGVARACFALQGTYKWCLSGTPVQNRIGEFFSLLRFLEVRPYADYNCRECKCTSLNWDVGPDHKCNQCKHPSLMHVSLFNQEILNPIVANDDEDDPEESNSKRKEAFRKLRLLTDRIMLRRMKRDYTASMELPPKEVIIHNEFFGEIEKDFANSIMGASTREFDTYVSRGVMLDNYANIFGLIMQMRQVADHPDLITKKRAEGGQNVLVCNICDEPAEEPIRSRCKHDFCRSCVKDYVKTCEDSGATSGCPRCHIPLTIDFEQPALEQDEDNVKSNSIINRIKMENWTSSTKIEMLVYDLWQLRNRKQTTKSIVFSQFTSMLQLVEWRLRRAGFNTVMLDGSMTPAQRQKSIEHFMTNADVEVFLVSLKAGGVALNLTEASRIFIIDPWWNPAAEWQSADRCHRIGQRRPCVITRLVVEDSIESRIVLLQEKKAHMINGTINNDDVSMEKLTPQDMQFLFRGS